MKYVSLTIRINIQGAESKYNCKTKQKSINRTVICKILIFIESKYLQKCLQFRHLRTVEMYFTEIYKHTFKTAENA